MNRWQVLAVCLFGVQTGCSPTEDLPLDRPVIDALSTRRPDSPVRLARWVEVSTATPTTVTLSWTDGDHGGTYHSDVSATDHTLPLLGLRPNRSYVLTATATDAEGADSAPFQIDLQTDPLPEPFPRFDVLAHDVAAMEPGLTLLDILSSNAQADYLVVLDEDLEVVWMYQGRWTDMRLTDRGTLMGIQGTTALEIDFMGASLNRWSSEGEPDAIAIDTNDLHHDAIPRENGGLLALSRVPATAPSYPLGYLNLDFTLPTEIRSPTIVELSATGEKLVEISLSDVVDPNRIGYGSLDFEGGVRDWAHGNAVVPVDDGYLVSLRYQDALVKVSTQGDLVWILGDPDGWSTEFQPRLFEPIGDDFSWFYHQHAPEYDDSGALLMFDNRNVNGMPYGPATFDQIPESRVALYQLDEHNQTVSLTQSWSDFGTGPLFSYALGDADRMLQTGNILAVFGATVTENATLNANLGLSRVTAHLIEFSPDDATNPALHLRLADDAPAAGWKTYRAQRIPALVPPTRN